MMKTLSNEIKEPHYLNIIKYYKYKYLCGRFKNVVNICDVFLFSTLPFIT